MRGWTIQPRGTNILFSLRRIQAHSRTFAEQSVRAKGHHPALPALALDAVTARRDRVQAVGLPGHRGFSTGVRFASRRRASATRGCNSESAFFQRSMNLR